MASKYYAWHRGNVHYIKQGMGDPLLLIHNIYPGADHREYERNITELARHFTIYAIDLLGFGDSDAPRFKYTGDTYVELINDFLRDEIGEPAAVVSSGLSCAYVTEVAARRPALFTKLVFICPRSEPTGLDSPRWFAPVRHFFLTTPPVGTGYHDTLSGASELKLFLRDCFYSAKHVTDEKVARLQDNARRPGSIHPYASLVTGYLDKHLMGSLPRVQTPILLIWGRQARPTPVEHSVRLAAMARAGRLEVVENAGAWPHDEQSAKVNSLIEAFLSQPLPEDRESQNTP